MLGLAVLSDPVGDGTSPASAGGQDRDGLGDASSYEVTTAAPVTL
jgi:hypothetical protein